MQKQRSYFKDGYREWYYFDLKSKKFGMDGLSMFYRLKNKQKDSKEPLDSILVTLPGIEPGLLG